MAKKAMAFRLSDAARLRLAELSVARGCSATRVIEDLLLGGGPAVIDVLPVGGIRDDLTHVSSAEGASFVTPEGPSDAVETIKREHPVTSRMADIRARQERTAEFQRKVGMTRGKGRKK